MPSLVVLPKVLDPGELALELERANLTVAALQDRLKEAARKNGEMDVALERLKAFVSSKVPKEESESSPIAQFHRLISTD